MSLIAKNSGGSFKQVPPGVYIARCYSLIDLGTQLTGYQDQPKTLKPQLRIGWELFGEDDTGQPLTALVNGKPMPLTIGTEYTVSMHEKATLRIHLAAWRGRDFTADEIKGFEVKKLLGAYCMVNCTTSEKNGKTKVAGITPLPSALKASKPAGVHDLVLFDLEEPDMEVFSTLYDYLKTKIKTSPEWKRLNTADSFDDIPDDEPTDDDVPF
jgi:hypothetical protein